jgi:hypothetical protein
MFACAQKNLAFFLLTSLRRWESLYLRGLRQVRLKFLTSLLPSLKPHLNLTRKKTKLLNLKLLGEVISEVRVRLTKSNLTGLKSDKHLD